MYDAAVERLGVATASAVAVEDSGNGMRSAKDAGMGVVAIPGPHSPVDQSALDHADVVLDSIAELGPEQVERALAQTTGVPRSNRNEDS